MEFLDYLGHGARVTVNGGGMGVVERLGCPLGLYILFINLGWLLGTCVVGRNQQVSCYNSRERGGCVGLKRD